MIKTYKNFINYNYLSICENIYLYRLNKKFSTFKLLSKFRLNNIKNLELSSGLYERDILKKLKKRKDKFIITQLFSVPKKPFIINYFKK